MAIFNEILVGRFNRGIQKLLGIKGPPPSPAVASEVMPVVPLFFGSENRYLEGWNRFSAFGGATGGVGQNSGARFRVPPGTNVIIVIEAFYLLFQVSDAFNVKISIPFTGGDLTTVFPAAQLTALDNRALVASSNAILSSTTNFGALVSNYPAARGGTNSTVNLIQTENQEITLLGTTGAAIDVQDSTVASLLQVGFVWRERALEDSEQK